ncbi:vacuole protein [Coprinopsis cinerea okayama7|uniref:Vacuole protein n=1 Tax=Coprinopsis cinerea (strain Okayama-7 / 130 / ATCC MYA-4618 / FGSC 9003) TaxID=240176 RepID=A8P257_COPC7|nr:vacuole protein [Coprinopsis cinerea okayama7\|eukprot:XP_001838251.2 vacuole protein [Coprinopsis cinerea okayama7\
MDPRLLQPRSYNASSSLSHFTTAHPGAPHTHSQGDIRQTTMELSCLPAPTAGPTPTPGSFKRPPPPPTIPEFEHDSDTTSGFIFPAASPSGTGHTELPAITTTPHRGDVDGHGDTDITTTPADSLTTSISSLVSGSSVTPSSASSDAAVTGASGSVHHGHQERRQPKRPSGLSLLRPLSSSSSSASSSSPSPPRSPSSIGALRFPASSSPARGSGTARARVEGLERAGSQTDDTTTPMGTPRPTHRPLQSDPARFDDSAIIDVDEHTPLLRQKGQPQPVSVSASAHVSASPDSGLVPPSYLTAPESSHASTPTPKPSSSSPPLPLASPGPLALDGSSRPQTWNATAQMLHQRWANLKHDIKPSEVRRRVREMDVLGTPVRSIPAVLLGCLLNILDGVSYGMIIFPATGVFAPLGPMGVSMFFVSAVVAQLVYTLGGSGFAGGNGSMMIEVVPFFHILANSIAAQIGEDRPKEIIATTLVAYAFSSVLTGVTFFLLGALRLGVLVGFFPRHILVGCIGGVGVFLILTGFAVALRVPDDELTFSLETLRFMFLDTHNLVLWLLPLGMAVLLRVVTQRWHHQLIFPIYFMAIPVLFYVVVLVARMDLSQLRTEGWLFDIADSAHEPWYQFYSYLDFRLVHFAPLWSTLPTQFALLFFNILHPPLNVPALAVSLDMDVDSNKELVAHGYSNLLSGLLASVPNYLVYVNTLLFYRVGGDTRISSFLLAVATFGLLVIGTGPIAYLPVMVVGALIFVLGIDLVKEALWDTRHRVSRSEYITILSIMITMTVWDFVIGVLFGIVVSCFFFVVQNSHRRSIRAIFTGDTAMSAVRRPSLQRAYIREVAKQTTVLRLQGFLFFGTIAYVEEAIRELVNGPSYHQNPVRFLVLDFSMVAGVDMSSAEALVRVQRLLSAKHVTLVLCGFEVGSSIGKSLDSVGLLGADWVELFLTFNDAMEWTENEYLRAWYRSQKMETTAVTALPMPSRRETAIEYHHPLSGSFVRSPRRSHIRDAGDRTIATEIMAQQEPQYTAEPLNTIIKAFSSYGEVDTTLFSPLTSYLEGTAVPAGHVLWTQGDAPDGLYILESGILRAIYQFANPAQNFEESMVAGTVAGELSALADAERNCTVVVESAAVLWKMSMRDLRRLQVERAELARVFIQLVLKAAKIDFDILLSAIASRR